ncbi:TetR/AcrR family transcriptional regulator [Rhodoplanes sp. TEM]|uniref:TetR/AcrR family transcriptional regulator n=1 Tax=Rhodoplanes tepidamans TaxID=200616 RepID=A0ABT5JI68_RHOTP|nr:MULTISPECIES: TetR/AcrR family transcriptional regulator [Rhodoplanes]MDC7789297.1 TetR/AcrR family transcriptional regulator [Rhodoplanes tepidamans]MDC7986559.1 TetR/AcrR family transcriptional regulator [Rhodoplanes sp. TEM]MDQ0359085.1 AcrR family transcriptional regulator [Rhodoplanes tepidamans]
MNEPDTPAPTETAPRRASIGARRNPAAETAILAAARGLLAEKGYAGFSIDEVARRAGAGKPTIYRWWPSKADLFIAVYAADKAAAIAVPDTGSLAADLAGYTAALWRFWRETPSGAAFRALLAEAQASEQAMTALREKFLPLRLADLGCVFTRAAGRGEIAAADAESLLQLYIGFHWVHLLTERIDEDAALIDRMARLIVRAGRPDTAAPPSR